MISAEVYPLKSRNLVDDEDDEFPIPAHAEMHLAFTSPAAAEQQPNCLIVQLDSTASAFVSSIIAQSGSQKVGHIVEVGRKSPVGEIFQSEACRILQFTERPAQEICFALTREIMERSFSSVVVLDALPSANYIPGREASSTAEVRIRYMASAAALKQPAVQADLATVPELDAGNIVTGLAASLINHCDCRNVPAVAFFVLREASLALSSVQALHASLPLVQQCLRLPQGITAPDAHEEQRLVRKDPFVSNTAILYV